MKVVELVTTCSYQRFISWSLTQEQHMRKWTLSQFVSLLYFFAHLESICEAQWLSLRLVGIYYYYIIIFTDRVHIFRDLMGLD